MEAIFEKYSLKKPESLIPLLQEIQEANGYLTDEIVEKVSVHLNIPTNRIYGVPRFTTSSVSSAGGFSTSGSAGELHVIYAVHLPTLKKSRSCSRSRTGP